MQACGNNVQQWNYSIVLLATQILVLASVADVFLDKNEVWVRFAGSLASLFLKIEQKRLFYWFPNIVLHTYQLLKRQNRTIINENRRRTELPCSSVSCLAVRLQSSKSKTRPTTTLYLLLVSRGLTPPNPLKLGGYRPPNPPVVRPHARLFITRCPLKFNSFPVWWRMHFRC